MAYHPSVGEEILIESPHDDDCFRARVKSVSGQPGDPPWEVKIEFERLDGARDPNPTCTLPEVAWSFDPAKEDEYREFQSRLLTLEDELDRKRQQEALDNY